MEARTVAILLVAGIALAGGLGFVVKEYFWPESGTFVTETAPDNMTQLAGGEIRGEAGHRASGTVAIIEAGGRHYLRFHDLDMTQGPDVYVYLTTTPSPTSKAEVESGVRILIDGGADGGEITKRGTFNQLLPADLDVAAIRGLSAWCDAFNVPFASATLA